MTHEVQNSNQNVVVQLNQFRKPYKSAFPVRFLISFDVTHLNMEECLDCMVVVEVPGM